MAQPQTASSSVIAGFASNLVAYGYAMSGTAVTSCAAATIVTTTLYSTTAKTFTGAQYSNSVMIY
jgi:hypothetical protein